MKHVLTFALIAASVTFTAGCSWFNNDIPGNDPTMPQVPEAVDEPSNFNDEGKLGRGNGFDKGGVSDWGKGADEGTLKDEGAAADADGWRLADPSGNRLNMPIIYFAYDSDTLIASQRELLDKIADYLAANSTLGLVIEGHCDQRGTDEYNRALGERRANAIRAYLAGKGVADKRMKTVSYGKEKPAVTGSGDSVWSKNRRGVPVPMIMPNR
ncbi:MAG: OmpA family protein [Lentisphaeria bacterium]|nr:OmpA family protein [Lentisphaeria bacterium]